MHLLHVFHCKFVLVRFLSFHRLRQKIREVVLKVELLYDGSIKKKAMKAVAGIAGVKSVSVNMEGKTLTLFGDIDPVKAVGKLRKLSHTEIVSGYQRYQPKKRSKRKSPRKNLIRWKKLRNKDQNN